MHNTTTRTRPAPRALLGAIGVGGILAATITGLAGTADATTTAVTTATTSTAYGAAASGTDPASPSPTVSSFGAVKTASGSNSGRAGTFSATGITVKAGAGIAESRVGNLTVAGESFGAITATCSNGVTKVSHNGRKPSKPNMKVSYGSGGGPNATGITVTITGAGGEGAQTVTAAVVSCGTGTPPPAGDPDPGTDGSSSDDNGPTDDSATDAAPAPRLHTGHHPVTG